MQSKKKMIVNTVFLVAIFALTIYGVFHGEDLGAMMEAMRRADVRWLLPGLLCVVFFIWGESIIIWYMMHSFQIPVKRRTCFLFSSVGFFFSCITRAFQRARLLRGAAGECSLYHRRTAYDREYEKRKKRGNYI